jgi:plasmid stability protein
LRSRAAKHGRAVEEKAREILRKELIESRPPHNLAAAIRARIAPLVGVEIELAAREPIQTQPDRC